ncbi:MAG TPA: hypothetical protein ENN41_06645 [Sediminispirochaeta sp.]|nr:hypothetical protein [Sediminispirochaeta sp.]
MTIFHLYRRDGSAIFLHPFQKPESFLSFDERTRVTGKYGREPEVENIIAFRDELYRAVDTAVRRSVADSRFLTNLLLSAGTFLLLYFVFTFGVRDPIPMLDEILLSLGITAVLHIRRTRKDQKRPQARELQKKLREKVDNIEFNQAPFVKEVEELLHRYEAVDPRRLFDFFFQGEEMALDQDDLNDARQLLAYLDRYFSGKKYRRQRRSIDQLSKSGGLAGKKLKDLESPQGLASMDLSLYFTYKSLEKLYHQRMENQKV